MAARGLTSQATPPVQPAPAAREEAAASAELPGAPASEGTGVRPAAPAVAACPEGAPPRAESAESPEAAELVAVAVSAVAVGGAGVAPPVEEAVGWVAAAPPVAEEPVGWAAEEPVDRRAARPVARPVEGSEAAPWGGRVASAEEPAPVPQVKAGRPYQPMVASTRAPTSSNART
jgi:hypothetical protein